MREPSKFCRLVSPRSQVFRHRYPTGTNIHLSRAVHIRASNLGTKPSTEADFQPPPPPPPSSTAIRASILERSANHQRLFKLLKSLKEKTHFDGYTTYFNAPRLEQALCDLASEDPPFKIASWSALSLYRQSSAAHAIRTQLCMMITPEDILDGDKKSSSHVLAELAKDEKLKAAPGYLIVNSDGVQFAGSSTGRGGAFVSHLPIDTKALYPLGLFATALSPVEDQVNPLVPIIETGKNTVHFPVHRTFIVHHPSKIPPKLADLVTGFDKSLVHHVFECSVEDILKAAPNNDGSDLRICTNIARAALDEIGKPGFDRTKIDKMWKDSRVADFKALLLKTIERNPTGTNQLPHHVRDSIAAVLATELPKNLPSLATLVTSHLEGGNITEAVNSLVSKGRKELLILERSFFPPQSENPFTVVGDMMRTLNQMVKYSLAHAEKSTKALYATISKQSPQTPQYFPSTVETVDGSIIPLSSSIPPEAAPPQPASEHSNPPRPNNMPISNTEEYMLELGALPRKEIEFNELYGEKHSATHLPFISDSGLPNFFPNMRLRLQALITLADNGLRKARLGYLGTLSTSAASAGLLAACGTDPVVCLALLGVMAWYSRLRFNRTLDEIWKGFNTARYSIGDETLCEIRHYLIEYAEREPEDVDLYNEKEEELEEAKKELAEARKLLLEMAPTLEDKFPTWSKGAPGV
ncbi:hypothetical protein H072_6218 [Dactylellina haptotyla CBS 200.50]|uniref:Uncharacterized protein n=1 Tax=Dactylellina haptotyla (strain CBS 200.50) TaxID=1284197 RepID=S8AAE0_DACHA|nr:hypothetical protein H072_6218 [Dactylellina haptotyla CBS 200.50]